MSKQDWVRNKLKKIVNIAERGVDKNIRIAVTGLSGAGKTAFITSFINQILFSNQTKKLPFWLAHSNKRIIAAKLTSYEQLHIPQFPYQASLDSMQSDSPRWPQSTSSISQARVSVKYKIKNRLLSKIQQNSHLNIDIVDYPGEWLLDLPMLNMSYKQWCLTYIDWLEMYPQCEFTQNCLWQVEESKFDLFSKCDELQLRQMSQKFREFLFSCQNHEQPVRVIQPGRFILPGELEGAPVLDFFPIVNSEQLDQLDAKNNSSYEQEQTNYQLLEQRYNYYRDRVVKPFFKEYFLNIDRQILLIDCLQPLNFGFESYMDLKHALSQLITNFNYGQSNWFRRIFKPSIDKLIIAATKADQVPPDQHPQLEYFMSNMLMEAKNHVKYQEVDVDTLIVSAIQVTEPVVTEYKGDILSCIKGIEMNTNKTVINYPGKIPTETLSKLDWQELKFNFIDFALPKQIVEKALPHFRMDQAIEKLIGDKLL